MSYNLTLQCGCTIYVACHPRTGMAHTRVLESRGARCRVRKHEIGLRLHLWELLPDPSHRPQLVFVTTGEPPCIVSPAEAAAAGGRISSGRP